MNWPRLPTRDSLQWRLAVGMTLLLSALWGAAVFASGLIIRSEIDKVLDSALQEVAQRVLPLAYIELLNRDGDPEEDATALLVPAVDAHSEYIKYIVRDAKGRLLLRSHDAVLNAFPQDLSIGFRDRPDQRLYTESGVNGTVFVTTAERPGYRQAVALRAAAVFALPLVLLLPISLFGVWTLLSRSLRPVRTWQREIEVRGRGNLTPIGATDLPAEIAAAAMSVDRMIERLARAINAERSFTANSAHELRTPIAAALAQTQRLLVEIKDGPARDRAAAIETSLRGLSRLSEKLLQLAKAEGGGMLSEHTQDLGRVLRHVIEDIGSTAVVGDRLVVTLPAEGQLLSIMDQDAFAILARNLIENALKHGVRDEPITVSFTANGKFCVANGSPVLAADVLERLHHPFERGAATTSGSGLGLAISSAISNAAGGHLELLSPAPGRADGFAARVSLPMLAELKPA